MAKKLVIVESPTKVKSISKFLGKGYKIEASLGHVRDLPQKKFGVNVEEDFKPHYVVPKKSQPLVAKLKKAAAACEKIYLAPDPDREGEAIAWHLQELLAKEQGDRKKIWRVTFNEITQNAVREAFKHPRRVDIDKVQSQQARRVLDRIVGYKISPLLWRKVKGGLSAGRVQSVALRLICERQEEIDNFVPQEYWSITAKLHPQDNSQQQFSAMLEKLDHKKIKIDNQEQADKIVAGLKDASYTVASVSQRERLRNPLPPFITSLLQQAAINQLGFTAQKTMVIAQQLYEGIELGAEGSVGLITYMRTDSFRVAKEAQQAALHFIEEKFGKEYLPDHPRRYKSKRRTQEAHEAIRPTMVEHTPESVKEFLNKDQLALYTLIWKRFLASQMASAKTLLTTILIHADAAVFKTTGTQVIFPGFLILQQDNGEEKTDLPPLVKGQELTLVELLPQQHFTKSPPYYTEATLVRALEENGIGRPSTYAPIIFTITRRNYVEKEKARLFPTELGKVVNKILVERFPDIIEVKFTAKMEDELDEIEKGKVCWTELLKEFYKPFIKDLDKAHEEQERVTIKPVMTDEICPQCNKQLVIRNGRYGKFLACSGFPECKHTAPLPTDIPCPQEGCEGILIHRRSRKGRTFFGCSKYPECTFTTSSLKKYQQKDG